MKKSEYKIHSLRLKPKMDLKESLALFMTQKKIQASVILSSVGSLSVVQIRLADSKKNSKIKGPVEIIHLNGTASVHGLHLHISVADKKGKMTGGHLLSGCEIYTTCELVILEIKNSIFRRTPDSQTGFRELFIEKQ